MSRNKCTVCKKNLADCETIWAAGCSLFCSRTCGISDYATRLRVSANEATMAFEDEAEEINPRDIGIKEDMIPCEWCGMDFEESELYNTDIGRLCDTCIRAITSKGESVSVYL